MGEVGGSLLRVMWPGGSLRCRAARITCVIWVLLVRRGRREIWLEEGDEGGVEEEDGWKWVWW